MACANCHTIPSEQAQLAYSEDGGPISMEMCDDCFEGFRNDEEVEVAWISPGVVQYRRGWSTAGHSQ